MTLVDALEALGMSAFVDALLDVLETLLCCLMAWRLVARVGG